MSYLEFTVLIYLIISYSIPKQWKGTNRLTLLHVGFTDPVYAVAT